MSIETWKSEFYPVPAEEIKTMEDALVHSLRKWKGLTKKSLQRHGLTQAGKRIEDEDCCISDYFRVDFASCALCLLAKRLSRINGGVLCEYCPLTPVAEVDVSAIDGCEGQYAAWTLYSDASPMIQLIQKVVDAQKEEV